MMIDDNILQIKYPTGQMNLVIDKFFPATLERARLVFRLMRDYSPAEDILSLYEYLYDRKKQYESDMEHYAQLVAITTDKKALREATKYLHESKRLYTRIKRNMELLKQITKMEEALS